MIRLLFTSIKRESNARTEEQKRKGQLNDFFKEYDNFTAIKLKNNDAEFTYKDNSKKTLSLK